METLQLLSRSEMKTIMAGYMNPRASACLSLYGGYYEECLATYGPSSDERSLCIDEVYDLSKACLAEAF